jgi:hypothetical protein
VAGPDWVMGAAAGAPGAIGRVLEWGSVGEFQSHDPPPFGDPSVPDESEFPEQGFWPGVEVGATLGRPSLDLLGVRLNDVSAGGPDRVQGAGHGGACDTGAALSAAW